ncbi:acidic mammalian chitinase-like [Tribolium madens]|uniref:acidic mammalian chitinase-like n=1 Tax=Tribolium madens TaxID=41895 RepID=UPI001CF74290|nr:acidic mammalian chitinase-like [Tribolium madens]
MFLKLCLLASALLISTHQTEAKTDKVLCFFASWAGYRNGDGSFKPQDINPNICTHVHYAFLGVNPDGTLKILDSWNEVDLHGLENVANLKSVNPELKVLISIGGWNAGNGILNGIVASSTLRTSLINSCLSFFSQWGYDGIDIDWEYPVNADKANFVKLLQEMKEAFGSRYVLSVTVAANPLSSYDIPEIDKVVDFINIMSYDYHTADQPQTGLNAPLYGSESVDTSVQSWLSGGASASKVTLSVPFYGHSWSLQSASNHDVGAPATTGIAGPFTQSPGVLGFNEICSYYSDWTRVWVDEAQVPYRYDGSNWVSYDDEESIGLKAKYAKDNGLAGVAVWSLDTDDFHGSCGTKDALLKAIKDNID